VFYGLRGPHSPDLRAWRGQHLSIMRCFEGLSHLVRVAILAAKNETQTSSDIDLSVSTRVVMTKALGTTAFSSVS